MVLLCRHSVKRKGSSIDDTEYEGGQLDHLSLEDPRLQALKVWIGGWEGGREGGGG